MMLADGYSTCQTIAQILKINCNVAMRHIQFEQMLERLLQFQRNTADRKETKYFFDEARAVFLDKNAKLIDDSDHSDDEERFVLLGLGSSLKVVVICHC